MIPVADRLAIDDLYARYSHAVDGGHVEQWVGLFTPDGVFVSAREHVGHVALEAFIRARLERIAGEPLRDEQHWATNLLLVRDGDVIRGRCYLARYAVHRETGAPTLAALGTYEDVIVRHDGEFRFARRTARML